MPGVTWIHLSDLHRGAGDLARDWPTLRDAFAHDLAHMVEQIGPPDLILCTGDLAATGREYAEVERLLDWLDERLGPLPLFAVPGNHDLVRPASTRQWNWLNSNEEEATREREQALTTDPSDIGQLFRPWSEFAQRRLFPRLPGLRAGLLPGDAAHTLSTGEGAFHLGLIGLNSAWRQYSGADFRGRISVSPHQLHAALPEGAEEHRARHHLVLLLQHHPPDWLAERAQWESHVEAAAQITLTGHLHVGAASLAGARVRVSGRSLGGLRQFGSPPQPRPFGYGWGKAELVEDGRVTRVRSWSRVLVEGDRLYFQHPGSAEYGEREGMRLVDVPVPRGLAAVAKPARPPARSDRPIDVFIAHATVDKERAEALHAALIALGLRPYLDTRDLSPGTQWDLALPAALARSRLVAVLVGPSYDTARYLRDEVVAAIELSRRPKATLQVLPIFLEGRPSDPAKIPYGLATVAPLEWTAPAAVAARLGELLAGDTLPPPPPPPSLDTWRRHQKSELRCLRVLGLRTGDARASLPLDDLFVDIELSYSGRGSMDGDLRRGRYGETRRAAAEAKSLFEALAAVASGRARFDRRGVVLVGPPGSGKSTLLQKRFIDDLEDPSVVPVLLRCATLQRLGIDALGPLHLRTWAEAEAASAGQPGAGLALLADTGRPYRFLLDGYDELQGRADREAVATWLAAEIGRWPQAEVVLTTRKAAWEQDHHGALEERLAVYSLLGLTEVARDDYVRRWFPLVAEFEAQPGLGDEARERIKTKAGALAEQLIAEVIGARGTPEHDRVVRLTGNPLMLSIVCLVFREYQRLPQQRGELYRKCFEVLVRGHRESGAARPGLEPDLGCLLLGPLAWGMQAASEDLDSPKEVDRAEVLAVLEAAKDRDPRVRGQSAKALLALVVEHTGLLVCPDEEHHAFAHLTFQEYLAFEHAKVDPEKPAWLGRMAGEPRWREPILLGQVDRAFQRAFYEAVLAVPGALARSAALVQACAREREPPAEPFVEAFERAAAQGGGTLPTGADLSVALALFGTHPPEAVKAAAAGLRGHADENVRRLAAQMMGEATLPAGRRRLIEGLDLELVWVDPGTFLMGATKEAGPGHDPEAYADEAPPHQVTLTRAFWLGRFPVTNAQYRRFVEATDATPPGCWRREGFDDPEMPVTEVSWEDAQAWCTWASGLGEGEVRLPTEAEWEWAARGPRGGKYPWGDQPAPSLERAWYGAQGWDSKENEWKKELGEHRGVVKGPATVGGRPAGAAECGAEDLAGNVWEWCQDGWRDDYRDDADGIVDPCAPAAPGRVVRGGAWNNESWDLRCAGRDRVPSGGRGVLLGFRVVCVPPPEPR